MGPQEEHLYIAYCWFWYCVSFTTRLKYGPKCYSKATYDLKRALIKHPSFQLSNMNNGYNDIWGSGTKWSCQDQIKSKPNSNQKSNLKQDFKYKSVSNAFIRLFMSLSTLGSQLLMWYFLSLRWTHCYKKSPRLIDLLSVLHLRDVFLLFTHCWSRAGM